MTDVSVDKILNGNAEDVYGVVNEMLQGQVSKDEISQYLQASAQRESGLDQLILGTAQAVRSHLIPIENNDTFDRSSTVDICGTGGDKTNSFNISTTTALFLGALGTSVVKNGNKAFSSLVGSSDVLTALGIQPASSIDEVMSMRSQLGITFLNTPAFFNMPNIATIVAVRKELKIRTVFNLVGPLLNPLGSHFSMIGVSDTKLLEPLALCAQALGLKGALIVCSQLGELTWDELTNLEGAVNHCAWLNDTGIQRFSFTPEEVGSIPCQIEDIEGGENSAQNAGIVKRAILEAQPIAKHETILLNASACRLLLKENANSSSFDFIPELTAEIKQIRQAAKELDLSHSICQHLQSNPS